MVRYSTGDLLGCEEDIILNIVDSSSNLRDSLIRGYAQRFPRAFRMYRSHCISQGDRLQGSLLNVERVKLGRHSKFLSFIFAREEDSVNLEHLDAPLSAVFKFAKEHRLSVAIPQRFGFMKPGLTYSTVIRKSEILANNCGVELVIYS